MYYTIPDLHIILEKNNNYEFYIDKNIFNVEEGFFIEGSALSRIDTKHDKFLFKINFENLKAVIYCNTDNISKKNFKDVLDEPKTKIISTDKNDICYISERNTKTNNLKDVGNWYLIKLDQQIEDEIKCIIEKIQDENEIKDDMDKIDKVNYLENEDNNYENYIYNDIEYDIESID
jgi:hypothetical protein